jgi:1,4-dihydroxy-2-naphthoate octaprenyltransferase
MNAFKNQFILLRLPFSLLLMPVFLFAISQTTHPNIVAALVLFFVIHVLVYPSSNAYNSYIDQDESSIGGIKNPPKATKTLYHLSIGMDVCALLICAFISINLSLLILGYILASRAYSSRIIRLKKYAIASYLVVMFFQGAYTFALVQYGVGDLRLITNGFAWQACSFIIGGIYPLTQIYQHEADAKSGDQTISLKLGVKGTFKLSLVMFLIAGLLLFMHFYTTGNLFHFYLFLLFLTPVSAYFSWWMKTATKAPEFANYKFTMLMSVIAAVCMNLFFALLIYLNLF